MEQAQPRRHPDVFTGEEAAEYLHLPNPATLTWLREQKFLLGHQVGKEYMYHRSDLDACACMMFGKPVPGAGAGRRDVGGPSRASGRTAPTRGSRPPTPASS